MITCTKFCSKKVGKSYVMFLKQVECCFVVHCNNYLVFLRLVQINFYINDFKTKNTDIVSTIIFLGLHKSQNFKLGLPKLWRLQPLTKGLLGLSGCRN